MMSVKLIFSISNYFKQIIIQQYGFGIPMMVLQRMQPLIPWHILWDLKVPTTFRIFLWQALSDVLPSVINFLKKRSCKCV